MPEETERVPRARLATAIAVSLMLSMASPVAGASGNEAKPTEAMGEDERKKKKREDDPEARSREKTAKIQDKLPDIGSENTADAEAEANRRRAERVASKLMEVASTVAKSSQDGATEAGLTDQLGEQAERAVNAGLAAGLQAARDKDSPWLRNLSGTVSYSLVIE